MDTNQYYCRSGNLQNGSSSSSPSSSLTQQPLNKMCFESNSGKEYSANSLNYTLSNVNSREISAKNASCKSQVGRAMGNAHTFSNCHFSNECAYNTSNTGSHINVMTAVPLGPLQYNRKKSSSHDYHSRHYYNTTDVKCRDEYFSNTTLKCSNETATPTSQQVPHSTQNYQQNQHQLQQTNQPSHAHQIQTNQQPIECSPSSVIESFDDNTQCAVYSNTVGSGRVVAATQTQRNTNNVESCDQMGSQIPVSLVPVNVPITPVMYTVHRVVTTAQIQTAVASTFASSASVSSVVSGSRVENESLTSAQLTSTMSIPANDNILQLSDIGGNVLNNDSSVGPLTGVRESSGTLTNFVHIQQSPDEQLNHAPARIAGTNTASAYTTSAKSNSVVSRNLQNVIPTCVYLMSRVAVHMEIEGTAQCPSQVMLAAALGCEELGISNKLLAQSIFGLWMTSSLLEMQLKAHHCPYIVRVAWPSLLEKFSCGSPMEKKYDEPMIVLKRNVFFSKRDEEKIKDHRIVELLYEEAKHCVLTGRYIMEPVHSLMLGGIQARIELGPYNPHSHTVGFFRENQSRFLPKHVAKSANWLWLPISQKNSAEVRLLEQFKRVPQTATTRKLMRKYLEFCWALPFYGAAFFHGQMEQPTRGIMSLINHKDMEVFIAVNERGVFIIDCFQNTLLLGLRYEDLSWDYAKPSATDDLECLTCIFLQFDAVENGMQISKLVQVFSKQAVMIDALIAHFTEQMKKKKQEGNVGDQLHDEPNPIQSTGSGILCNKLSRLTLASFDEEGRCIGQMGSLSISY